MNVSLSNYLRNCVRKKVERGDFPSEEAVLQEAVRRFQQEDQPGPGCEEKAMAEDLIDHEAITDRCAMKVTTASHLVLDFQQNLCKEGNLLCAAVSRYCARELEGKDVPSIEEVRRFLAKIPGSMAQAVIEERENRS